MAEKYLYGAAVQGIQSFIFQTNKLREIVGASELVEQICNDEFAKLLGYRGDSDTLRKQLINDPNCILHAAGNIKYEFDSKEKCEEVFRIFPKTVSEFAPGITASQAVVVYDGEHFEDAVQKLEKKLRAQRNRPMRSQTLGMNGILRSRQTGLPVVAKKDENEKEALLDDGTWQKLYYSDGDGAIRRKTTLTLCRKAFYDKVVSKQVAYNIEDITDKNDWIAVIHADGNGLGQIVQQIGKNKKLFKDFSEQLDDATKSAARSAFNYILAEKNNDGKLYFEADEFIPIRPIVLGGDDFTVICRADFALEYISKFIECFECNTSNMKLGDLDKLTICAGIAFVKSSYPFYYAYNLAETLCTQAKNDAKCKNAKGGERMLKDKVAASCLMFHKVQDSFVEDWKNISSRELQPQTHISYNFGPYYIQENWNDSYTNNEERWTVAQILDASKKLDSVNGNAVKSGLRNWLSLIGDDEGVAEQKLLRLLSSTDRGLIDFVKEVTNKSYKRNGQIVYPVYNILIINTIKNQVTKEEK